MGSRTRAHARIAVCAHERTNVSTRVRPCMCRAGGRAAGLADRRRLRLLHAWRHQCYVPARTTQGIWTQSESESTRGGSPTGARSRWMVYLLPSLVAKQTLRGAIVDAEILHSRGHMLRMHTSTQACKPVGRLRPVQAHGARARLALGLSPLRRARRMPLG